MSLFLFPNLAGFGTIVPVPASLPGIPLLHLPVNGIENFHLIGGPCRGQKYIRITIRRQSLDHHVRRQDFQNIADRPDVLLLGPKV